MNERVPPTSDPNPEALQRAGWKVMALVSAFGLFLLWQAIEFGLAGSWPAAVILFLAFGGVEAFAFIAAPYMFGIRKVRK